jgi:hypothetical protein
LKRVIKIVGTASLTILSGCASHRDAGAALVTAGAVVATAGAVAATGHTTCGTDYFSCTRATSKNGAVAAGAVGAGVALAAAGAAIEANASDETTRPAASSNTGSGTNGWRLIRKPNENAGDPETP